MMQPRKNTCNNLIGTVYMYKMYTVQLIKMYNPIYLKALFSRRLRERSMLRALKMSQLKATCTV